MGAFSDQVIQLSSHFAHTWVKREAQEQGGLLSGHDPTDVNTADPIRLWIIQLGIIMCTTQLLAIMLSKLRQPRVIAEVLCGIVLGPTAMGRVPGFTEHIFPTESRSYLNLTATIGLVLFLFLVGLEIDVRIIQRNVRSSLIISIGAICLPLGIGFGMAVPIYNEFVDKNASVFTHFALFVAVAYSITAFPVLCRILTELKILDTTIGVIVVSAGVGNDIVGWTLLALTVALVNAGSGIEALYILLTAIAWALVILIPVKRLMLWLARRTGSIENGSPTLLMMTMSMMMMFASAFFTDVIGVHAIFGAFLAGLAIPHEGGLAITLTEKLEDLTSIVFLPLYFTLSGLSTDLGLLNNGKIWGYTIGIISTAYFGKAVGGFTGARAAGFPPREAAVVGTLLSCKGLIELIVLNIGLAAGILDTTVFSMFVLEALVLTFGTTPMTLYLYPASMRKRVTVTGHDFKSVDLEEGKQKRRKSTESLPFGDQKLRLTVVLDKIEHMSALMTLTRFLQAPNEFAPDRSESPGSGSSSSQHRQPPPPVYFNPHVSVDALRLIHLSERTSALMKSAASDELIRTDSLLTLYRTFGDLHNLAVSSSLSIVHQDGFATTVAEHARAHDSEMIVLSWVAPGSPHTAAITAPPVSKVPTIPETTVPPTPTGDAHFPITPAVENPTNPFEALFRPAGAARTTDPSILNTQFVRHVFAESNVDVALYVDRSCLRDRGLVGVGAGKGMNQHILFPFFGGPDDRLALAFVVQLCAHPGMSATIVRMRKTEASELASGSNLALAAALGRMPTRLNEARTMDSAGQGQSLAAALRAQGATVDSVRSMFPDTVYPRATTQTRLDSDTADNIAWERHSAPAIPSPAHERIQFVERSTPAPIHVLIDMMDNEFSDRRLILAVGRARRLAVQSHQDELNALLAPGHGTFGLSGEVRKTVGDIAACVLVGSQNTAALIVLQAAEGAGMEL